MLREIIIENCDLLCHFFDSIDRVISKFVRVGGYAEERDLTFLLCEQLDKDSPIQANIGTSLSLLNDKMKGMKIEIEIKKHNQRVEGEYSNADIGIIADLSALGEGIRKAILLQAKILNSCYKYRFEYDYSFYRTNNKQ